jgi:hypothetical protein
MVAAWSDADLLDAVKAWNPGTVSQTAVARAIESGMQQDIDIPDAKCAEHESSAPAAHHNH